MESKVIPLKGKEWLYTYRNSQQISSQTGLIGYVRADMGTLGTEFFSTWNGFRDDLNTQDFKDDIDTVINSLREDGGFLSNRDQLETFCMNSDNVFSYDTGVDYGVRVNTKDYAFLMRLNPYKGNYSLYCYCYKKDWLDSHLEKAEKGIRFIDSRYNEKFRLEDGDEIIIKSTEEKDTVRDAPAKYTCRYIDDYHFEYGRNLRHICEFAELCERTGNTVIPLRASLPNQCYIYVQTVNKIGIVKKGESGYYKTDLMECNNINRYTKAKEFVNELNEQLGVTPAQREAMKAGSMFGWQTPAADPKNYTEKGTPIKPKNRSHDAR